MTARERAQARARATSMTDLPLSEASKSWSDARLACWLGGAYAALILLGFICLRLPGATIRGNELSFERSIFTAINAATLTGFQQAVALDLYGRLGQATVMTLMIGGSVLSLLIGGLGLARLLKLPYDAKAIASGTFFTYVFALSCGTSLLLEPTRGLVASVSQAASAFGNSGLYLGTLPGATDWRTHAALMPLAFLGGLGIPIILELTDAIFRRQSLSKHARIVLLLSAVIYLVGLVALMPWGGSSSFADMLASGSVFSIDSRTCGLPVAAVSALPRAGYWAMILLMMIGAAPAGTAGGMKITALYHGWRGTRRALRRETGLRITGIAATWIIVYVALVFATLLTLQASLPDVSTDRLAMLAASAVGNVGLSHEPVTTTGMGLATLSVAMLIGRAAPLLVLWWAAMTCDDADVGV